MFYIFLHCSHLCTFANIRSLVTNSQRANVKRTTNFKERPLRNLHMRFSFFYTADASKPTKNSDLNVDQSRESLCHDRANKSVVTSVSSLITSPLRSAT